MHEDILKEAVNYFKEQDYKRIFEKMRAKYESFGKCEGNIILENPTQKEKQDLSGFMKKDYQKNKTITISLKRFEERLQETRFAGISLHEILEQYFDEKIYSKKEEKQQKQKKDEDFFQRLLMEQNGTKVHGILEKVIKEKNGIYLVWKNQLSQDNIQKKEFEQALKNAFYCYNNLPNEKTKIAVFSAVHIKNPHGLDKNTQTGRIFTQLLAMAKNREIPKSAEAYSELYYESNLLIDDVSNMVLCKNIRAFTNSGEHMGWKGFFEAGESMQITLENLSKVTQIKLEFPYCIVTENPSVFTEIATKIKDKKIPIICTYGQVNLAGILLLNLLSKKCEKIYYSGDCDPEGVQIADKLKSRYGDKIELIGFDEKTYYRNISDVIITEQRLNKLENIKDEELIKIANCIKKFKRASYEELNTDGIMLLIL